MHICLRRIFLIALAVGIGTAVFGRPGETWSAPKGTLVLAQAADPTTLDPQMHSEIFTRTIIHHVYDALVRRVYRDGQIKHLPMLATSWEAINDTTWIFHLRKGVKFHNGEDFNADAVKYTIERMLNPAQKARYRWAFTFIDRVEIADTYTVRIITKVPAPTLVINLGFNMDIVPAKYFKEKGDAYVANHPVGTGPFKFVRWIRDQEVVFEANENYWAGPPKIKTVIFKPIPEDSTRVAALLGGDVDIVRKVPSHLIPVINQTGRAKVMTVPSGLGIHAHLDSLKEGPLQDKRVRQAINYGVDKESIIKYVLEGYGKPLGTPLTPPISGYDPNIKPYPYNPEKARALLKEAGYGNGLTLTYNTPMGRYDKDKEFAEAIAGHLSKVGITVKVAVQEWGNYSKLWGMGELGPMWTIGWAGTYDPDGILYPLLHCGEPLSRYCNKKLDGLLDQARSTLDQKKRQEIYRQALELIHEEAPWLFLFQGVDSYGVSNRVQNFEPTSDDATSIYLYEVSVKD